MRRKIMYLFRHTMHQKSKLNLYVNTQWIIIVKYTTKNHILQVSYASENIESNIEMRKTNVVPPSLLLSHRQYHRDGHGCD